MASLPASILGPQSKFAPIVDKEKFQKELQEALQKTLQGTEAPAKEKHIRTAIIASWREKGCSTLWKLIQNFPLQRSNTVCWKACYMLHKVLRDGYPENCKKSAGQARFVSDLAKHWSKLGDGYSRMIACYLKVIWIKIATHVKNPEMPANLNFQDKAFPIPNDIDYVFQLAVEVFDYQSAILHLYSSVLANIDPSRGVSANQIQCRISPFVPAIQESAALYDFIYKLMKALHTSLPADTLSGHRERFNRQYHALRKYFAECKKMAYLTKFVDIPTLPPDPPNFLLGSFIQDLELSQQVVTHPQPDESLRTDMLLDISSAPQGNTASLPQEETDRFDAIFGPVVTESFIAPEEDTLPSLSTQPPPDEKDNLIEQLMREIIELKERIQELEGQVQANYDIIQSYRQQLEQKETELDDYKDVAEQATQENVLLKAQLESFKSGQGAQSEAIEARAEASEKKFTQLKEVYGKLRNEHIVLLRNSAETQKKLASTELVVREGEKKRVELERQVTSLGLQLDEVKIHSHEEVAELSLIRESLKQKEMEFNHLEQSRSVLQERLVKAEESGSHSIIVSAVEEAENIIKQVMEELNSPVADSLTSSPTYLSTRTKSALGTVEKVVAQFSKYSSDSSALNGALATLLPLSQSVSEVMVQTIGVSHTTSADTGNTLSEACKTVGEEALKLLASLKIEKQSAGTISAGAAKLKSSIQSIEKEAEALRSQAPSPDDNVGDLVEEEMASTALAIDEAARRIEEMLKKSREEQTGVNLEVNGRILDSCTDLMKAIQVLIQRSKELQKEIVSEGMGSMLKENEYYKKNSRWSEGLISAAKQVGFGASLLVDAADKVVSGEGKFEKLIVTSRDIAASTAQLVAASKVKARTRSEKLKALKGSSRAVSEATGSVVASAQSGADLKAEAASKTDYSKLTLNQTKRFEMESQVRALELEKELEMERTRLAELRKIHYHLGGAGEGWDEEQ